jgi:hypothetical protein
LGRIYGPFLNNVQPLDPKMSAWLSEAIGYNPVMVKKASAERRAVSNPNRVRRVDENPEFLKELEKVMRTAQAYVQGNENDNDKDDSGFTGLDGGDLEATAGELYRNRQPIRHAPTEHKTDYVEKDPWLALNQPMWDEHKRRLNELESGPEELAMENELMDFDLPTNYRGRRLGATNDGFEVTADGGKEHPFRDPRQTDAPMRRMPPPGIITPEDELMHIAPDDTGISPADRFYSDQQRRQEEEMARNQAFNDMNYGHIDQINGDFLNDEPGFSHTDMGRDEWRDRLQDSPRLTEEIDPDYMQEIEFPNTIRRRTRASSMADMVQTAIKKNVPPKIKEVDQNGDEKGIDEATGTVKKARFTPLDISELE